MQAAGQTLLLAPCMNLLRHPLWGRAQETYGEDPFHIGRLASAMVVGVQQHIAANAKHYMGYDIENGRADERLAHGRADAARDLRASLPDGGAGRRRGVGHGLLQLGERHEVDRERHTLTDVLRNDFGFKGFILSDWWADAGGNNVLDRHQHVERAPPQGLLNAGLDVELPWGLQLQHRSRASISIGACHARASSTPRPRAVLYEKYRFNADGLTGSVGLGAAGHDLRRDEGRDHLRCDPPRAGEARGAREHGAAQERQRARCRSARRSRSWPSWAPRSRRLQGDSTAPAQRRTSPPTCAGVTSDRAASIRSGQISRPLRGLCEATGGTFVPVPDKAPPGTLPTCTAARSTSRRDERRAAT